MSETKGLIAYCSRDGKNYVGGNIVNLPVGNTEVAANMILKLTGGDIFRIDTVKSLKARPVERLLREVLKCDSSRKVDRIASHGILGKLLKDRR